MASTTLADAFAPEDRVQVKFSDFYAMMKRTAEAEAGFKYMENAVKANVPNAYIQSMLDGVDRNPDDLTIRGTLSGLFYGGLEEDKHDT